MKKGYKAFDSELKCREFQFEVGQTYELPGPLKLCENGFHYCEKLNDIFNYYPTNYNTRVCEIEALGDIASEANKSCTLKIKLIRELSKDEIKALTDDLKFNSGNYNSGDNNSGNYNSGDYNSGNYNSGHYNSGDRNSGRRNSGHRNSGNYNSGDNNSGNYNSGDNNSGNYNSGDYNSGNYNSGHYNSGDRNSGNYNSGDRNSGNYNSGCHNSGFFNTDSPKVRLFDKDTDLDWNSKTIIKLRSLNLKPILQWVPKSLMSEEEKNDHPSHKTTGGYLKNTGKQCWDSLTEEDKEFILSLPGYDDKIFKEITGISLTKKIKKTRKK